MKLKLRTQGPTILIWHAALALLLVSIFGCTRSAEPLTKTDYRVIKNLTELGGDPTALIEPKDGNLYGSMSYGGSSGEGVVFKLGKDGSGYTVLHNFAGYRNGEDGSGPQGLVEGSDGALYGTTQTGGSPSDALHPTGSGTVFKVTKDGSGYTVLHRFPSMSGDGVEPWAGLVEGRDGAFYGTTLEGGQDNFGTIFRLSKDGSSYAVLHSFLGSEADGFRPMAGLLAGSDGAIYGTTDSGGNGNGHNGTVFKLSPDGSGFKILHSFPDKPGDGRMPRSRLLEGPEGSLYGTTTSGGTNDAGTVFTLKKDGSGYRILHGFSGSLGLKPDPQGLMSGVLNGVPTRFSDDGDGSGPTGLVAGSDGALYGVTEFHGKNGGGIAFKLNADGSGFTVLHNFPGAEEDGQNPAASLVQGSDGSLYGMTKRSSNNNFATLFKLSSSVFRTTPAQFPK